MCIVNYIPVSDHSFVLTHSRDERIKRPLSSPPIIKTIDGVKYVFPVDLKEGGTWIGASETGRVPCILNGAEKLHSYQPPYRHSRGLIIPAYFSYSSYASFFKSFKFSGLEPFTLIVFENQQIYSCVFSGDELKTRTLDRSKAFIRASSSLYSAEDYQVKKNDFETWRNDFPNVSYEQIIQHNMNFRFERQADQLLSYTHPIQTISMTSVFQTSHKTRMDFYDLVNGVHIDRELRQQSEIPA